MKFYNEESCQIELEYKTKKIFILYNKNERKLNRYYI